MSPRRSVLLGLALLALAAVIGVAAGAIGGEDDGREGRKSEAVLGSPEPSGSTTGRAGPFVPAGAQRSFARFAAGLSGRVAIGVAPLGRGGVHRFGDPGRAHAWSTIKVPLLLALVRDRGGFERLSASEREWADAAITRSDNGAAAQLFEQLKRRHGGVVGASRAIDEELRAAGDDATSVNTEANDRGFSTYGQTEWSASSATKFFQALGRGCAGVSRADAGRVLALMERVVPDQRWGLGEAPFDTRVALKPGWGPEQDGAYLVRESGVVGSGRRGYAVTIVVAAGRSRTLSFGEGRAQVGRAAAWVQQTFGAGTPRPAARCR